MVHKKTGALALAAALLVSTSAFAQDSASSPGTPTTIRFRWLRPKR